MVEEKLVWFINFTPNVQEASRRLTERGIGHVVQWGREASPRTRAARLERWRADPECRVLIGTTSIERSLNLQAARHLVAIDTITNPARMAQLAGRIKRAGSAHRTVYFHQLLLRHTQEDAYPALLAREQAVADYVWGEAPGMFQSLTPLQLLQLVGDPSVLTAQAA
jgi:SNF2 family DNA or RNA helicase